MRNLNARDMLRFKSCEQLLGCNNLTPELRYEQARMAARLRNFFFTATLQPVVNAAPNLRLLARTPTFSDPLIITELISLFDFASSGDPQTLPLQVLEYGGQERSLGLDYFGLSGRVPQRYILKHEKNRSIEAGFVAPAGEPDLQGRFVGHVPRLLAPFQQLEFDWTAYHPTFANGEIVFSGNAVDGDTVTVNGVVFTFKDVPVAPTDVQIGASLGATRFNLLEMLQASTDPLVQQATYISNDIEVITVTFVTPGTAGNAFTLAEASATIGVTGPTLTGGANSVATDAVNLHLQAGIRSVRSLPVDNPYAYFTALNDRLIKDYINNSQPETFFLEALLPVAQFPAVGATVMIKTPQMDRPLLVLGASSNVEGVQAELIDESKYYQFTATDTPIARQPLVPLYKSPPLALWACNSDFRNYNLYHMWAVPHLLDRGCQFIIKITNGLTPDTAGTFTETIRTRSEQPARITFLCRTV